MYLWETIFIDLWEYINTYTIEFLYLYNNLTINILHTL